MYTIAKIINKNLLLSKGGIFVSDQMCIRLKISIFCLWLITALSSGAQNLVPNGSFEVYDSCPQVSAPVNVATPWVQATFGTTDYYNACGTFGSGVPMNSLGYQNAKEGLAYVGIAMYADNPGTNYREYIQVKMIDSLLLDSCYKLTFYVALAENIDNYQVTHFSAYFSSNAITTSNYLVLPCTPQITYVDPAGIGDTSSWYKVEGIFQSDGTEQHMTIGNFRDDASTTRIVYHAAAINYGWAYYYIDSVSLVKVNCPIDIGIEENQNVKPFKLFPNPSNGTVSLQYVLNANDKAEMKIYDVTGKLINSNKLNSIGTQMDVQNNLLKNGVYFYQISVNNKVVQSDKLIIIK